MSHESLETLDVGLAADLKAAFRRNGWLTEEVKRACAGDFLGRVRQVLLGQAEIKAKDCSTYPLSVDYSQTLAQMIKDGNYDGVDNNITADHFPIEGEGRQEVEVTLFHFNRIMSSEQATQELEKAGYRPAILPELLALGADQPELQRKFPIVALGSRWRGPDGDLFVPYLFVWCDERRLDLHWFERAWRVNYRFAAVRK